MDDFMLSIDR